MFPGAHVTMIAEGLSLTISKNDEEVELCAMSGKYRSPKFSAYNLVTGLRLLKGWLILNASWKERDEFRQIEQTLFDEMGGEVMSSDKLQIIKYGELFELSISSDRTDEWICTNVTSGEQLYFYDNADEHVRYAFFKKYEPVVEE
jgi:hypothetical protein